MVRRRKLKEQEQQDEEERKKDELETEIGRRLQEDTMKERSEWEARYGDCPETSGTSTTDLGYDGKKDETTTKTIDIEDDGIEMEDIDGTQRSHRSSDRDENGDGSEMSEIGEFQSAHDGQTGDEPDNQTSGQGPEPATSTSFKFFDRAATAARMQNDNTSDVTAIAGSEGGTRRLSRRFSGRSLFRRLSRGSARVISQSEEALVSHDGSDGHSHFSEQAVMDEGSGLDDRSLSIGSESRDEINDATGPMIDGAESSGNEQTSSKGTITAKTAAEEGLDSRVLDEDAGPSNDSASSGSQESVGIEAIERMALPGSEEHSDGYKLESDDMTGKTASETDTHEVTSEGSQTGLGERADAQQELGVSGPDAASPSMASSKAKHPTERAYATPPELSDQKSFGSPKPKPKANDKPGLNAKTVKTLPERNSKIVQSFRTNEWAKHLSDAEAPEPEPIAPLEEHSDESEEPETAAPVNREELLQTPLNAQPPPIVESRLSIGNGNDANEDRRMSNASEAQRQSSSETRPGRRSPNKLYRVPSASSSRYSVSSQPRRGSLKDLRSFSTPYLSGNPAAGPSREEVEGPKWKGPPPLIEVRENRVRNRQSFTAANHDPWASRTIPGQGAEASAQASAAWSIREEEEDDLPLSQRRIMLHQQRRSNTPRPSLRGSRSFSGQGNAYPGYPGSPGSTQNGMAAWRQSVREDLTQRRDPLGLGERSSGFGETRHPSSMSELHREAMRRMQAGANRRAG